MEKTIETQIQETVSNLLKNLTVEGAVEVTKLPEDHYQVNITTVETGLLIGFHGETINSLQLITGIILFKKLGKWVHVVLDVGGYRQMREESIKEMVTRIVAEVKAGGQPVVLPYLTPLERRIVHMMLSTDETVASESMGEGRERRVTIKLK